MQQPNGMRPDSASYLPQPGLMQYFGLTVDKFLNNAADWHSNRAVVTRHPNGSIEHSNYAFIRERAKRISNALLAFGILPGERIATLAGNSAQHVAIWYGTMGIGVTCHTVNPRLFDDQIIYIINHAADRIIFADVANEALLGRVLPKCPTIEKVVYLDETGASLAAFTSGQNTECAWGDFSEDTAAGLCYTSGTTGNPKGVLYSHRSNYLHALNTIAPDAFAISSLDVILPIVPMYHANTWSLIFSAPAVGAKLVLPGPKLDGRSLYELIESEGVIFSAGVPTVLQGLLDYHDANKITSTSLKRVVIGGAHCPESLYRRFEELGVNVLHAWGMTELSSMGLTASPTPDVMALPPERRREFQLKQGRPLGINAKIIDDSGNTLPHDGNTAGVLHVRGPAVLERYLGTDKTALTEDGWLDTGDISTIDPFGFVRITDRAKDIIKSGGEWISSVDIENAVMAHQAIYAAAAIGIPHPKWGERPKLFVQLRPGASLSASELYAFLEGRVVKWWLPEEISFVEEIPVGPTGKIDKKALRVTG